MTAAVAAAPRSNFLTDAITSRDIFGVRRGACNGCTSCGCFIVDTSKYTIKPGDGRRHPDNDITIAACSRCGCSPEAHQVLQHEHNKELGNDAFALHNYDAAIGHYSRALELHKTDAVLWSNRSAAYLAKGWYDQALHDVERALSLKPDWSKAWGRKGAALLGLNKPTPAVAAYVQGLTLDLGNAALIQGHKQALDQVRKLERSNQAKKVYVTGNSGRTKSVPAVSKSVPAPPKPEANSLDRHQPAVALPSAVPCDLAVDCAQCAQREKQASSLDDDAFSRPESIKDLWEVVQQQYGIVLSVVAQLEVKMQKLSAALEQHNINKDQQQEEVGYEENPYKKEEEVISSMIPPLSISMEEEESGIADELCSKGDNTSDGHIGSITCSEGEEAAIINSLGQHLLDTAELENSNAALLSTKLEPVNPLDNDNQDSFEEDINQFNEDKDENSSGFDSEELFEEWVAEIEASVRQARTALGGEFATVQNRVPPPPSIPRKHPTQQQVHTPLQEEYSKDLHPFQQTQEQNQKRTPAATAGKAALGLSALQSLCRQRSDLPPNAQTTDINGVYRLACKHCELGICDQFVSITKETGLVLDVPTSLDASWSDLFQQNSRMCQRCGCSCEAHETETEAVARLNEDHRLAPEQYATRQHHFSTKTTTETSKIHQRVIPQQRTTSETDIDEEKIKERVEKAKERRRAAEEAGEVLLEIRCDALTQAQRGKCTACTARNGSRSEQELGSCTGFCIYYRTTDANDPEVMFYCSICGCKAEDHEIDLHWKAEEDQRRAAEAAAAAQRAQHARRASNLPQAPNNRAQELEALEVLGLGPAADERSVNKAYKRLALRWHPDRQHRHHRQGVDLGDNTTLGVSSSEEFVKVTEAYQFLLSLRR